MFTLLHVSDLGLKAGHDVLQEIGFSSVVVGVHGAVFHSPRVRSVFSGPLPLAGWLEEAAAGYFPAPRSVRL